VTAVLLLHAGGGLLRWQRWARLLGGILLAGPAAILLLCIARFPYLGGLLVLAMPPAFLAGLLFLPRLARLTTPGYRQLLRAGPRQRRPVSILLICALVGSGLLLVVVAALVIWQA
jgi:hypothetical protein